jgi:HEAT repeat protein
MVPATLPRLLSVAALLALGAVLNAAQVGTGSDKPVNPAAQQPATEEARYFGKPTSYWIDKLSEADVKVRRKAIEALTAIGPAGEKAVPALIQALDDDDPDVRVGAIDALAAVGPAARQAIPALSRAMSDRSPVFCTKAMNVILNTKVIDKTTVRALLIAMKDGPNDDIRYRALDALKGFGTDALRSAAPTLVLIAKDKSREEPEERAVFSSWQTEILELLPRDDAKSRQLLIECLGEPNPKVYEPATRVLAKMADKANFAIPALRALATSFPEFRTEKTPEYRWPATCAAYALFAIGPEARQTLLNLLGNKEIGKEAAWGVSWDREKAMPFLMDVLQKGTPVQRGNAAAALGARFHCTGKEQEARLAALRKALQDEDAMVRQAAQQALKKVDPYSDALRGN